MRAGSILDPALEQETHAERERRLSRRLLETVAHARAHSAYFRRTLPERVERLEQIPILRKDDLPGLQAADPPFGGLIGVEAARLARVFASPGPILDPQGDVEDFWRFRPALAAAGFRRGDVVMNSSSYHLTPLGFMLDSAARSLGCVVVPAGTGQTDLQVRIAATLRASGYLGTPSFLYALLKRGRELGTPLRIEVAFVTAEMLPESLRAELENDFQVRVLQGYGTADLGLVSYECTEKGGMHLHPESIVEVLDLETGAPAAPGEPGQIVATIFDEAYPLLRLATGDIGTMAAPSQCACRRTAPKLAGLLGRVGDAVKVKGMFIRGAEIEKALKAFPGVVGFQAVITRDHHQDHLEYVLEVATGAAVDVALVADALRDAVKVRGEVRTGDVAKNAKRIDDRRVWK
ncbi:MAG TPA: AMP-binding protein [Myxococcales bacterium]|nr:AMP-binding protein [Myxococcales bacterium]